MCRELFPPKLSGMAGFVSRVLLVPLKSFPAPALLPDPQEHVVLWPLRDSLGQAGTTFPVCCFWFTKGWKDKAPGSRLEPSPVADRPPLLSWLPLMDPSPQIQFLFHSEGEIFAESWEASEGLCQFKEEREVSGVSAERWGPEEMSGEGLRVMISAVGRGSSLTGGARRQDAVQISKERKFVADGIFKAELNEFLTRELAEDGYSGVEVRVTPTRTEIIILATRTQNVLGEKGRRIRELTAVVQKRFGFPEGSVEATLEEEMSWATLLLYAEKVATRGLCAIAQAESLRYKLLGGLAVRRACYGVLRFIMESGAKGCEVMVSGKLRGQRAKSTKFVDGLMIHSGDPVNYYVDTAVRHVLLRQGVLGIKVKIMLPWDPTGKIGPKKPLPDHVSIVEPKDEILPTTPISEQKDGKPEPPAIPQPVPTA
ncbi:small ribosomal subunit protein uS3-like [Symphalangus syndactylus]|uniref:small ribosomal subunit protein uS3-like n=1 Tax=Symphalangus syndactylus TaxID=9590 RepID=UPI002441D82E|nr:40S ribosomal protein S3-like [Symphalangus syndactylus]